MDSEIIKTIVDFNTYPNNQRIKNYYRKDNIWNLLKNPEVMKLIVHS